MRAFLLAVLSAVVLAALIGVTLSTFNPSIADATATSSVRLDRQEAVNWYGREYEQHPPKN